MPEDTSIWLQPNEAEGTCDCGCLLVRANESSDDPAFVFCPLHDAAEELYKVLERFTRITPDQVEKDPVIMFALVEQARHVLEKAKPPDGKAEQPAVGK